MKNPILESLRHTRERLLEEAGGTLDGLVKRLQAEEAESARAFRPPHPHAASPKSDSETNTSDVEMAKLSP